MKKKMGLLKRCSNDFIHQHRVLSEPSITIFSLPKYEIALISKSGVRYNEVVGEHEIGRVYEAIGREEDIERFKTSLYGG